MSHCGWNSTESLSHGKPILAWPIHSDQPWDSELIYKYLRAGVLVLHRGSNATTSARWEQRHDVSPVAAFGG
jgi:cis-zeatin O-glucosyltransferase